MEVAGRGAGAERLRFQDFILERLPTGRCRARVTLAWPGGVQYRGDAEGMTAQASELRAAATAAVRALEQVVGADLGIELLGVKAVRAFDATVVIVSLSARRRPDQPARLVGSFLTDDDPARGAALAVLNATNRLLGNFMATR